MNQSNRFFSAFFASLIIAALFLPAAAAAESTDSDVYGIVQLRIETGHRELIRFDRKTGEAWTNSTVQSPAWGKISENGPVPLGDYEVLVAQGVAKEDSWAVRFDKKSGKTWNFGRKGWEEFSEPK